MSIKLRPAIPSDAAYLLRLEDVCMRSYAEALWGTWEQTEDVGSFDTSNHFIIQRNGLDVGCVAGSWHSDHLFLDELYIDVPYQRQGIGAIVLALKTEEAAARGLPTALSVLMTNPAEAFYRREGFVVLSETSERRLMVKAATVCKADDRCTTATDLRPE